MTLLGILKITYLYARRVPKPRAISGRKGDVARFAGSVRLLILKGRHEHGSAKFTL
jgi:hypothetical protein